MSVVEVKMFTVICDNCKKSADEGTDYSCWSDENYAKETADEAGYVKSDDLHYCPNCFEYDDDDNLIIKNETKNP